MKSLVIYSSRDTAGKHDASGAFAPEADAFAKLQGEADDARVVGIDCRQPRISKQAAVMWALREYGKDLDLLVLLCHGWPDRIQLGFRKQEIMDLVSSMRQAKNDVKICLFACSTAENEVKDSDTENVSVGTEGGFASMLRDAMVSAGFGGGHVDAHKTAGHATRNPFVVRFDVQAESVGHGGQWLIKPGSDNWKKWAKALAMGYRMKFPLKSREEILADLASIQVPEPKVIVHEDLDPRRNGDAEPENTDAGTDTDTDAPKGTLDPAYGVGTEIDTGTKKRRTPRR